MVRCRFSAARNKMHMVGKNVRMPMPANGIAEIAAEATGDGASLLPCELHWRVFQTILVARRKAMVVGPSCQLNGDVGFDRGTATPIEFPRAHEIRPGATRIVGQPES